MIVLAGVSATLAGCGHGATVRASDLGAPPLAGGAAIVARVRTCDPGASSFCALELVLVGEDHRYRSSSDLVSSESQRLREVGWAETKADTVQQHAAESPGHKVRVTYATAFTDLKEVGLDRLKRSRAIQLALSQALYDRASAISLIVEAGA